MNHHMPAMPHGQPPMPPPRRQQDLPYAVGPPNMRSPPAYMGYHLGHPPPPYSPHQYPQWYPAYPQMQLPPRPYQPPYGPMIVSSYPPTQPVMAPAPMPPPSLHLQPRTSTPMQATISPVGPAPPPMDMPEHPPAAGVPVNPSPASVVSSPPAPGPGQGGIKSLPYFPPLPGPFRAPVPWLSVPEKPFPARAPRKRRTRGRTLQSSVAVELPAKGGPGEKQQGTVKRVGASAQAPSEPQTPTLSAGGSDVNSTQPTTPSSAPQRPSTRPQSQPKPSKPAVPVVPVVPVVPRQPTKDDANYQYEQPKSDVAPANAPAEATTATSEELAKPSSPARTAPKSWADLVRSKASAKAAGAPSSTSTEANGLMAQQRRSLADVLTSLGPDVSHYSDKVTFLEPRGLVNTGNMCYMNSVLQILVSCVPFYRFLDHIGRQAAHSFQSDVPLVDAMIMFLREFRVIDATQSEEQLKLRLKPNELEEYGEAFIPEFVYQVIRQLPRFRHMRRGHQQDAQEFLGFLLEEMHEECARAAKHTLAANPQGPEPQDAETEESGDGWLEVGHKQKPAVTRSSGDIAQETPITRIFGGKIRSEFRVPGNKTSVTLEPYQSLQLDIGSSDVHNIVDALKGLTKSENIQGDFNSARGPNVTATKQIFLESLPPVLILHLKRFQYDSVTQGTQKIWKKIGYPLDLEIPREVFPASRRNALTTHGGLPKYRLIGVIYHHGKNASGGHYTVDARRQDGREWIRLDDTVIRRVRSEDVAEAGSEEDPKALAAALEQHKRDNNPNANIYDHIDQIDSERSDSERGWSQVNGAGGSGHSSKKSTSAVPNAAAPSAWGPRSELRDNKVAYLLFYEQVA